MTTPDTDAELVASHLAGDPSALAGIYDRYADSLHDTAAAMLNDRHESADVLQDVILIAAERLEQLRDPERLKPWLFAILRNEVYRRTKKRRRTIATDFSGAEDGFDMADDRPDVGDEVSDDAAGEDLAELVRGAARGLDERDQLVLELSVRQGLDGQDLADALGVSANQSYTLVHRMRERVERSLAAFVVAKAGRNECDDLDKLLGTWDGEFTVLIRKRVARHIDKCEVCSEQRGRVAAFALFGAAPVLAAPPGLRDRILQAAAMQQAAPTPYGFTADGGFPRVVRASRRIAAWVAPTAAASLILVVSSLTFAWLNRNDDAGTLRGAAIEASTTVAPETTTTEPPAPSSTTTATSTSTPSTTAATSTTAVATTVVETTTVPDTIVAPTAPPVVQPPQPPAPTSPPVTAAPPSPPTAPPPTPAPPTAPPPTAPPTTRPPPPTTTLPPAPGQLSVSGGLINLGDSSTSGSVTVSNTGGLPVDFSVTGASAPFSVAPTSGTLAPGTSVQVVASINRSGLPEGQTQFQNVQITGAGQSFPLDLQAGVERPPTISINSAGSFCGTFGAGPGLFLNVDANISDESGVAGATFAASGPQGQSASVAMQQSASWFGNLSFGFQTASEVNGSWSYTVTASDGRGNSATSSGSIAVSC